MMEKETKELLKRTLAMTDDKLLLKFANKYAAKDQTFAEAIIEKFLPIEKKSAGTNINYVLSTSGGCCLAAENFIFVNKYTGL